VSDPKQVLHAADVLLMTSRTEGMPGVIIEAGLTGVPCVAPAVGAIADMVVDGESGVVVPTDAPTAVALGVRRALARRDQLGTRARTLMRSHYTWDVVLPSWVEILDATRARRHGAARSE
jgi:glycosyltransferase involved in cell wall biosynthesis